jgi:hypothetical protein
VGKEAAGVADAGDVLDSLGKRYIAGSLSRELLVALVRLKDELGLDVGEGEENERNQQVCSRPSKKVQT